MGDAIGIWLLVITMNAIAGGAGGALHTHVATATLSAVTATAPAAFGTRRPTRAPARLPTHHLQRVFGGFVIAVAAAILLGELV